MDENNIKKEDLKSVTGGSIMGGTRDIEIRCPNCKSFNYAVLLSERVAAFNKVKLRCVDCKHAWEMLIPLFDQ